MPDIVRQIGVTTEKSSPNLTMVVHLVSPDNSHDALYLRNYGQLNVRDELLRIPGMGSVIMFGAGDYAMRVWLDPAKLAARSLTTGEVIAAIREQNAQVAAGTVGASPTPNGTEFQLASTPRAGSPPRRSSPTSSSAPIRRPAALIRVRDLGRVELSSGSYSLRSLLNNKEAAAIAIFQAPGSNALALSNNVRAKMEQLKPDFPRRHELQHRLRPDALRADVDREGDRDAVRGASRWSCWSSSSSCRRWRASIIPLLAVPVSIVGTFAFLLLLGYSINTLTLFGLVLAIGIVVDDAIVVVENAERNIEAGLSAARRHRQGDAGGLGADRRDRARAVRGVRPARLRARPHRAVLQAVRGDDRDQHRDLGLQLADALAGAERAAAAPARRAARTG